MVSAKLCHKFTSDLLLCPTDLEKSLQTRLSAISRKQLAEGQDIQDVADDIYDIKQQQKTYKTKVKEVQTLIEEMKHDLEEAKTKLRSVVRHHTEQILHGFWLNVTVQVS